MASIEFLTKRVEGKKAELKKLTAKMERIEKAQAMADQWGIQRYYSQMNLFELKEGGE